MPTASWILWNESSNKKTHTKQHSMAGNRPNYRKVHTVWEFYEFYEFFARSIKERNAIKKNITYFYVFLSDIYDRVASRSMHTSYRYIYIQ